MTVVARLDRRSEAARKVVDPSPLPFIQAVVRGTVSGMMSEPDLWVCAFDDPNEVEGVLARIFSLSDEGKTWARGWWTKAAAALRTVVALSR